METAKFKAVIDKYLGMTSTISKCHQDSAVLTYRSPTGIKLFDIEILASKTGWQFAGWSDTLGDAWHDLCRLHIGE